MYTVKFLISELEKLDPNLPVCAGDHDGFPSLYEITISLDTYGENNDQPVVCIK